MNLVKATLADLESVSYLFNEYMQFYKQPSDQSRYKAYLKERMDKNEATIFLAMEEGKALGFVLNYQSFSSVSLGKVVVLNDLYVLASARKRGIAEQLIKKVFEFGKEVGAVRVDLGTAKDNIIAQSIYERLGFVRDDAFYAYSYQL